MSSFSAQPDLSPLTWDLTPSDRTGKSLAHNENSPKIMNLQKITEYVSEEDSTESNLLI